MEFASGLSQHTCGLDSAKVISPQVRIPLSNLNHSTFISPPSLPGQIGLFCDPELHKDHVDITSITPPNPDEFINRFNRSFVGR